MPFFKTAALKVKAVSDSRDINLQGFRVQAQKSGAEVAAVDPNYTYAWITGLHGDTPNNNGDFFAWPELLRKHFAVASKRVYETWVGQPNLLDHNHMKAVGSIIDSGPVAQEKSVDMVLKIDKAKHGQLCEQIRTGKVASLSMGCRVEYSICSRCGNTATNESEWCACLAPTGLNLKGKVDPKSGQFVYEDNRDVTGEEVSWITFGEAADPKAVTKNVLAAKATEGKSVDEQIIARGTSPAPFEDSKFFRVGSGPGPRASSPTADSDRIKRQLRQAIKEERGEAISPYASPADVLAAINRKLIAKTDAISHAIRLGIFKAEAADSITVADAMQALADRASGKTIGDDDPVSDLATDQVKAGKAPLAAAPVKKAQVVVSPFPEEEAPSAPAEGDVFPPEELPPVVPVDLDLPPIGGLEAPPEEGEKKEPDRKNLKPKDIPDVVDDAQNTLKELINLEKGEETPEAEKKEHELQKDLQKDLKDIDKAAAPLAEGKPAEKKEPEEKEEKEEKKEPKEKESKEEKEEEEEKGEESEKKEAARQSIGRIDIDALADALQGGKYYANGAFHLNRDGSAFSYGEVIGKKLEGGKYWISSDKFSVTTSQHQSALRQAAEQVFTGNLEAPPGVERRNIFPKKPPKEAVPFPPMQGRRVYYSVRKAKGNGAPGAVSWIVRANDKDVFRVTASRVFKNRKAFDEKVKTFESADYADELLRSLHDEGVEKTIQRLGGMEAVDFFVPVKSLKGQVAPPDAAAVYGVPPRGVRKVTCQSCGMSNMIDPTDNDPRCRGCDKVLTTQASLRKGQVQVKIPPGQVSEDMRMSDAGEASATEEKTEGPSSTTVLEKLLATIIASTPGMTVDQAMSSLVSAALDPVERGKMAGRIQQAVDEIQAGMASSGTPAGKEPSKVSPADESLDSEMAPEGGEAQQGGKEQTAMKKEAAILLTAAQEKIKEAERRAETAEREAKVAKGQVAEMNRREILKIRAIRGKQLASQMAESGYIDEDKIENVAVELAKLDDANFTSEAKRHGYFVTRKTTVAQRVAAKAESEASGVDGMFSEDEGFRPKAKTETPRPSMLDAIPQQDAAGLEAPSIAGPTGKKLSNLPWSRDLGVEVLGNWKELQK